MEKQSYFVFHTKLIQRYHHLWFPFWLYVVAVVAIRSMYVCVLFFSCAQDVVYVYQPLRLFVRNPIVFLLCSFVVLANFVSFVAGFFVITFLIFLRCLVSVMSLLSFPHCFLFDKISFGCILNILKGERLLKAYYYFFLFIHTCLFMCLLFRLLSYVCCCCYSCLAFCLPLLVTR